MKQRTQSVTLQVDLLQYEVVETRCQTCFAGWQAVVRSGAETGSPVARRVKGGTVQTFLCYPFVMTRKSGQLS